MSWLFMTRSSKLEPLTFLLNMHFSLPRLNFPWVLTRLWAFWTYLGQRSRTLKLWCKGNNSIFSFFNYVFKWIHENNFYFINQLDSDLCIFWVVTNVHYDDINCNVNTIWGMLKVKGGWRFKCSTHNIREIKYFIPRNQAWEKIFNGLLVN